MGDHLVGDHLVGDLKGDMLGDPVGAPVGDPAGNHLANRPPASSNASRKTTLAKLYVYMLFLLFVS